MSYVRITPIWDIISTKCVLCYTISLQSLSFYYFASWNASTVWVRSLLCCMPASMILESSSLFLLLILSISSHTSLSCVSLSSKFYCLSLALRSNNNSLSSLSSSIWNLFSRSISFKILLWWPINSYILVAKSFPSS